MNHSKNVLVVYGTGLRSKISFEFVNSQLRFIDKIPDMNFYFCSFTKKLSSTEKIVNVKNITEILDCYSFFKDCKWGRGFRQIDEIVEKYKIDTVYMYGMPCIHNNDSEVGQIKTIYKESENEEYDGYSNFSFLFRHIKFHILPYYLGKKYGFPVYQFVNDPLEIDFTGELDNYHRMSFLNNTKNAKFHPYIDYGHTRREIDLNVEKDMTFIFGSSDLPAYDTTGKRTQIIDRLLEVDTPKFKYMLKSKRHNIDTTVKQDEYNRMLSKAYFSYVIPSHDNESFSFIRFLDIIHSGTVPLIHPSCNIDCAFDISYRDDLMKMIDRFGLVKDVDEVEHICKNVSEHNLKLFIKSFFNYYLNTSYYQRLHTGVLQ